MPYAAARHKFVRPPELNSTAGTVPVVIVGAGPVGMAMAVDLSRKGVRSIVLERGDAIGVGSKAICWAKRSLEIFNRLGCGQRILDKGITWNVGKVFSGDSADALYQFDLLPEDGHQFPAFVNLQQYYVEEYLVDLIGDQTLTELRWQSEATGIVQDTDGVLVDVTTPEGIYQLRCQYLLAADGSRSAVRRMLGLEFTGRVFKDHFLIADLKMEGEFPSERWFWFDPPEGIGNSALLHRQADDVWRTDYQLGWNIDRDEELKTENVAKRVRKLLGPDRVFSFEWISIYTFECRRLERFVHDRVVFIGDSAHLVSPFGARGGNGGIQDIDNLAWKLRLVLEGRAGVELIESYNTERVAGADENILNSSRATDFMTPKNAVSGYFRRAVLELAPEFEFAQKMVNSGRLSVPVVLADSSLVTKDTDRFDCRLVPGSPCVDAPVSAGGQQGWLLSYMGESFIGLFFDDGEDYSAEFETLAGLDTPVKVVSIGAGGATSATLVDADGSVTRRYDGKPGTFYLVRPDQHVAGRFRTPDVAAIRQALARAICEE